MELILNRATIRRLGIQELSLESIHVIDFSRFFSFKHVDAHKFKKHLKWKQRKAIDKAYKRSRMSGRLLEKLIANVVDSVISDEHHLMKQVEGLKSIKTNLSLKSVSRFITEHIEFMDKFHKELAGKRFIPLCKKTYKIPKNELP